MNIQDWTNKISVLLAKTLNLWALDNPNEKVIILSIDCHPWNGLINLSVLTDLEAINSPLLKESEEIASWKHFDFSSKYSNWKDISQLTEHMKKEYTSSSNKDECANSYFRACVRAVNLDIFKKELSKLNTATNFKICIAHPDTSYEFYA